MDRLSAIWRADKTQQEECYANAEEKGKVSNLTTKEQQAWQEGVLKGMMK